MTLPFTLTDLVTPVQTWVAAARATQGLAALNGPDGVGTGTICVGAEYLDFQLSPPGIILVPTSEEIGSDYLGDGATDGTEPTTPKRYWKGALTFDAWCWGDEDPNFVTTQNTTYSFDSALELRRELCLALATLGGIPSVGRLRGRWDQPTNVKRLGRMYVLSSQMWTPIDDLDVGPLTVAPFATSTSTGVSIDATVQATSPDGTQTTTEATVVAPPP